MLLSNLRNYVYWFRDWLKGGQIRKHYEAVKKINEDHISDFSKEIRKKYLEQILRHALKTVPYYRQLRLEGPRLDSFPVMDKNQVRTHADQFISDEFVNGKIFKATTSGSTGTPFTVLHNIDKKKRHQADVRYYWETIGHSWGTRFYYLKIWNRQNHKNKWQQRMENIVPVDVFKMDGNAIRSLLNHIRSSRNPKSILGYASALDLIVKYLQRNPSDIPEGRVVSVVAMSESLDIPTKKFLKKYFRCPVVSRYANIENGMLAQQTAALPNEFLLNYASYHFEILSLDGDAPVPLGEVGRIVVTDFFNRAMPLIRYDTGDLGIMGKSVRKGRTQFVLEKVEGRKMDAIYDTKGEPISSFTVTNSMWKYSKLAQYQFIQHSKKKYEFKLNSEQDFKREKELVNEFQGYLGRDAEIVVTYVDEIPLLSSGKRKKVINRIRK